MSALQTSELGGLSFRIFGIASGPSSQLHPRLLCTSCYPPLQCQLMIYIFRPSTADRGRFGTGSSIRKLSFLPDDLVNSRANAATDPSSLPPAPKIKSLMSPT